MKRALIVVLLTWAALPGIAQTEKLEVELSQPGKAYTLEVSLIHGSIHLTRHTGKNVVFEVRDSKTPPTLTRDGMRKITADGADFSVEEKNNQIKAMPGYSQRSIHLVIHAPEDGHFILKTVNNGNITAENIGGEFEVTNVNGKISLINVSGSAVASTINGRIDARFLKVKTGAPMAFSTLNGSIDLSFPSSIKANIRAKSDRGEIFSDFEVGALRNESAVNKTHDKGMTRIETSKWVTGAINQGGPELMVKTVNGNIYLKRNK